ncbi:hemagglutinin repeat-containing protein, partial [Xanthomonas oryzae]
GKADGQDITQRNSHLSAGNTATLISGNDTTLKGAVLSANTVLADIGGDLNIESLQDSAAASATGSWIPSGPRTERVWWSA